MAGRNQTLFVEEIRSRNICFLLAKMLLWTPERCSPWCGATSWEMTTKPGLSYDVVAEQGRLKTDQGEQPASQLR